ncbi:DUF4416 family protein [Desulfolutivibrio sulfoxidireducens]|uniref:DUF4416 family protein n=1 Tax=Desulfolutivibrio sulfoxidireducens TaxID=2773299 RepID=UPI00159EA462|nr:DUF4416 family protein [Desulfolutivibrio sulfoxidireducens]QLA15357.1 DUF4416 family protein [Desulfolutivibrio sulfoxidireducens]QLA18936.1 DUF4416 family protein [Desulfolutivibrio sulfoxidireducens]
MSIPVEPCPAMAVLSVLSASFEAVWPRLLPELESLFGPPCRVSDLLPFDFTTYYDRELGRPIFRRVLGFSRLVPQDALAGLKLATNALEAAFSRPDGRRLANLDPGLLTQERLVLATGKNFGHRIYLKDGIFADLTLVFQKGSWQILPWTFPDYRSQALQAELSVLRERYRQCPEIAGSSPTPSPKDTTRCPKA